MNTDWTRRSTLSPGEIEVLAALDFDPAPTDPGATGDRSIPVGGRQGGPSRGPVVRQTGWLESAYPHLTPHDRRIRATAVAIATVLAIVAITLVVFPVMA